MQHRVLGATGPINLAFSEPPGRAGNYPSLSGKLAAFNQSGAFFHRDTVCNVGLGLELLLLL
jgi:hypothetical protein